MQTFAINITDNSEVECNETFSIAILSLTTCGVTIGSNRVSEVIIRDDDGKYLIVKKISLQYQVFAGVSGLNFDEIVPDINQIRPFSNYVDNPQSELKYFSRYRKISLKNSSTKDFLKLLLFIMVINSGD